jgi:phosphate starvation-inducible PhoH-like protein
MKKDKNSLHMPVYKKTNNDNIKPNSFNQKLYFHSLNSNDNNLLLSIGPAGCGKTMFACLKAIDLLKNNEIDKIVITRPVVPVEEELGFLPGNLVKKMDPWTRPIFDIFLEHYTRPEFDELIYNNIVEISPLAFMRGRTFKNSFIIADEMQNSSPCQMKMLTTRIGLNSRMVITGDLDQSDRMEDNGLRDFITKFLDYSANKNCFNSIKLINLNSSDINRNDVVKDIIDIYNHKKSVNRKPSWINQNNYDGFPDNIFNFDELYKRNATKLTN